MARQGLDQSRPNKVLLVSSMIGERLQKLNDRIEGRSGPAMVFGENIEYTNLLRNLYCQVGLQLQDGPWQLAKIEPVKDQCLPLSALKQHLPVRLPTACAPSVLQAAIGNWPPRKGNLRVYSGVSLLN